MLQLGNIKKTRGATKQRKRLGRGSGTGQGVTLDFIQFVPITMDPTRPWYKKDGTIVP